MTKAHNKLETLKNIDEQIKDRTRLFKTVNDIAVYGLQSKFKITVTINDELMPINNIDTITEILLNLSKEFHQQIDELTKLYNTVNLTPC